MCNSIGVCSDSLLCLQVPVHQLMKKHYQSHAQTAFPPIPSVPVTVPVSSLTLQVLCYKARYESAAVMPAALQQTMAALVEAAQQLDQDTDVRDIQRAQQDRTGKVERRYLPKRNGSNRARQILKFTLNGVAQDQTTAQDSKTDVCPAFSDSPLVPPWLQQHNESYSRYGLQGLGFAWRRCVRVLSQLETKVFVDMVILGLMNAARHPFGA